MTEIIKSCILISKDDGRDAVPTKYDYIRKVRKFS